MNMKAQGAIFRQGSKTYYNSTRFFPKEIRWDVYRLYGFVRVADNFVDAQPQDAAGFYEFCEAYRRALGGQASGQMVIDDFVDLSREKGFDPAWAEAFLASMEMDLTKKTYETLEECLRYIYGSAEVIGLYMARIMGLPPQAETAALALGKSMQFINFIRDVAEDQKLGRRYLPTKGTPMEGISWESAQDHPEAWIPFMRAQTAIYQTWQQGAEAGYKYIPRKYLVPIKTASDMYNWTAAEIHKDPMIVFQRKVKPSKSRILWQAFKNQFYRASK